MRKHMKFSYEEEYHRMGIQWKKHPYYGTLFLELPLFDGFCCLFPCYGKLMGKPMNFPYDEVYHRMGIEW